MATLPILIRKQSRGGGTPFTISYQPHQRSFKVSQIRNRLATRPLLRAQSDLNCLLLCRSWRKSRRGSLSLRGPLAATDYPGYPQRHRLHGRSQGRGRLQLHSPSRIPADMGYKAGLGFDHRTVQSDGVHLLPCHKGNRSHLLGERCGWLPILALLSGRRIDGRGYRHGRLPIGGHHVDERGPARYRSAARQDESADNLGRVPDRSKGQWLPSDLLCLHRLGRSDSCL